MYLFVFRYSQGYISATDPAYYKKGYIYYLITLTNGNHAQEDPDEQEGQGHHQHHR